MKVAIILIGGGSVPRIRQQMALELAERGHRVYLFAPIKENAKVVSSNDSKISTLVPPPWLRWACGAKGFEPGDFIFRTWHLLIRKYDMIYVSSGHRPTVLLPCVLAKFLNRSVLVEEWWEWWGRGGVCCYRRGGLKRIMSWYDSIAELPTKRCYDIIISITSALANRITNHRCCHVVRGALDESLVINMGALECRSSTGLNKDYFIIGMSNVETWDHADNYVLFEAVGDLCRNYPNVRLVLTGDENFIKNEISKTVPKECLIILGWMSFEDYKLHLSSCDLFVLPYPDNPRNKGRWPNKFGDYIALKRPIVSNDTGDVGTLLRTYSVGFICNHEKESYYKLLEKLFKNPQMLEMNEFEFDTIIEKEFFTFSQRITKLLDIYNASF